MFPNRYRRRQVAESDKKGCFVCYKPSSTVLVNETPSADFFYICASHLKDKGFAKEAPVSNLPTKPAPPQLPEKPSQNSGPDLQKEIAQLKKDWDSVKKTQDGDKPEEASQTSGKSEKSNDKKIETPEALQPKLTVPDPMFYELNPQIFKLRIDARKRIAQDRKTRQVLATQSFPQVPGHAPTDTRPKPSGQ